MEGAALFPLRGVYITNDAFLVCMSHALSTEKEEVMGLLLGDIKKSPRGSIAFIWQVSVLARSDKRKDRVEIEPEQLTAASAEAERLSTELGKKTRVIGWYHSHPHITVHPSHVDVRTQGLYQMMDSGFVGLIISCFNNDPEQTGRIQVIAFQSLDMSKYGEDARNNKMPNSSGYEQIHIPLSIVPGDELSPNTLAKIVDMQIIVAKEEKASYLQALQSSATGEGVDGLTLIHSSAVYQKALCRLLEYGCFPLQQMLIERQAANEQKIAELRAEKAKLLARLAQPVKLN
jgi:BRCA1/BRCA2-containing complex subunit 3